MRNDFQSLSRTNAPVPLAVWVASCVIDDIRSMTARSPDVENGGILLGPPDSKRIVVTQATGPGPRAVREKGRFLRDTVYCQSVLDAAHQRYGWDYVGEWHSHVVPLDRPSGGDVRTLLGIIMDPDYDFQHFLMLLATLKDRDVSLTSYVAFRSRVASVALRVFEHLEDVYKVEHGF